MFRDILEKEEELDDAKFIRKVSNFSSLDLALVELEDEYIEYYARNEKRLDRSLKRLHLKEGTEDPGYLGMSRPDETIRKKIKFKGEILILEWDNNNRVWIPLIAKRTIVGALKYAKTLVE